MFRNVKKLFSSTATNRSVTEFSLSLETKSKLRSLGVTELFPIQQASLDPILKGKDVVAKAKTGTGKTFAFAIPIIEKLQSEDQLSKLQKTGRRPRVLTLAPTRELANQTATAFSQLISYGGLSVLPVYGGVGYQGQIDALRQGVDIIVGAPGRVKDLLERGVLSLVDINHVILDEVDRMLDMGFVDDVDSIIQSIYDSSSAEGRPQTMLFSATIPRWISDVSNRYLDKDNTEFIKIEDDTMTPDTVRHIGMRVEPGSEPLVVSACLRQYLSSPTARCIVFCGRKNDADVMSRHPLIIQKRGALHGDMSQPLREKVLKNFRSGKINVLFTTDVAARGLDIPDVELVIQLSPPHDIEAYVHRSGRTGRAGKTGVSICLYSPFERSRMMKIEELVGIQFEKEKCQTESIFVDTARSKIKTLEGIPDSQLDNFSELAKEMIEEMGAEKALSLCLAKISGIVNNSDNANFVTSVLSQRRGHKAMILRMNITFEPRKSLLFNLLENSQMDVGDKISFVQFTKNRKAIVFDIAADAAHKLESFRSSDKFKIAPLEDCPELEKQEKKFGFGNRNNSFQNRRRLYRSADQGFKSDQPPAKRYLQSYKA